MKRRTWRRFKRELRRWFDPVELGQTRGGLFLAAVIIAGWQLCAPVRAEVGYGSSNNDYFRMDWYYDLDNGTGLLILDRDSQWFPELLILDRARFVTAGTPFEEMKWLGNDVFGPPRLVGYDHGLPLYEYAALAPINVPEGWYNQPIMIDLRFNPENAQLRAAEFRYDAYSMSAGGGVGFPIPSTSLPFVTIQTVPEPAAVATAVLGAAALAALNRKRD